MTQFYAETKSINGQWIPCTMREAPEVKNGRIKRTNGIGPRIRPMGDGPEGKPAFVVQIDKDRAHLPLSVLSGFYSPDHKRNAACAAVMARME